jgi:hypothetical protein
MRRRKKRIVATSAWNAQYNGRRAQVMPTTEVQPRVIFQSGRKENLGKHF